MSVENQENVCVNNVAIDGEPELKRMRDDGPEVSAEADACEEHKSSDVAAAAESDKEPKTPANELNEEPAKDVFEQRHDSTLAQDLDQSSSEPLVSPTEENTLINPEEKKNDADSQSSHAHVEDDIVEASATPGDDIEEVSEPGNQILPSEDTI
jgi:hypothetical protein